MFSSRSILAQANQNTARAARDTFSVLNRFESINPSDEFAVASPADSDLGEQVLLTEIKNYRPFILSAEFSTIWTSNAFFTSDDPASDVIMGASASATALPHLGANWFFEGFANISGYRYFRNSLLDFNSVNLGAGLVKIFPEFFGIGLYAHYEYSYLFSPRGGNEILHEHSIVTGVRKTVQFSRANALFLSAEANFVLGGEPAYALAHDVTFFAAHQVQWARMLKTSLFYQMQILSFWENGRTDLRNNVGLSLTFQPFKWFSIYSLTWLGWNSSNEEEYDFFVANLGGGLGGSITF